MVWENDKFKIDKDLLKLTKEELRDKSNILLTKMKKEIPKPKVQPESPCLVKFVI